MSVSYVAYVHRRVGTSHVIRNQVYRGWDTVHHVLQYFVPEGTTPEEARLMAQVRCSKRWKTGILMSVHRMDEALPRRVQKALDGEPLY